VANTYSQIYLQFVFAVQGRRNVIPKEHKEEIHKYITSLVQSRNAKMLAVHCMPDHMHLFAGMKPSILISDFVKEVKVQSHAFIEKKKWLENFQWQEGYGAFSYSHSQIEKVCLYIQHQEEHHKKISFKDEYQVLLEKFGVEYNEKYLFTND
jgi:putative transposase